MAIQRKKNKPERINNPLRVGTYVAKYIVKSYTSKKRSKLLWRVRKTQNLGLQITAELLSMLPPQHLLNVATCNSLNPKINERKLPPNLIKIQALKTYQNLYLENNKPSLTKVALNLQPQDNLLLRVQGSNQTITTYNQLSSTTSLIQNTANTEEFDETWELLKKAAEIINAKYFRKPTTAYGAGSYRDHILPTIYTAYRDWETDRKSTRLNSSHSAKSRMPSSA